MKNSLFISIAAMALTLGVKAMPASAAVATEATVLDKRAPICVFVTNDAYWRGPSDNQCAEPGVCWNESPEWEDKISSIGPNRGYCRAFFNRNCNTDEGWFDFQSPGIDNLATYGDGKGNDRISSWRCIE